jgi:hypothetical protein
MGPRPDTLLDILQIRKGMWAAVASRLHNPIKIFPSDSGSSEVMLYGTVAYTLKDGRKANVSSQAFAIAKLEC